MWKFSVNTLKASCEEFVFVDQGLCKWILLASNSGTFAQNSLGISGFCLNFMRSKVSVKVFCFRDSQFFL